MKTAKALQLFMEAMEPTLIESSDTRLRVLERRANLSPADADRYHAELIRTHGPVHAASIALAEHGRNYVNAHTAMSRSNRDPDDSDAAWKENARLTTAAEKAHGALRKAVHQFRRKHDIPAAKGSYYGNSGHKSFVGSDSFVGKILPPHEPHDDPKKDQEAREDHARAVAGAVQYSHDNNSFLRPEDREHIESAIEHHHPEHKQEWEVIEHNPDGTPNYLSFGGLKGKKKPTEKTSTTYQFRQGMPITRDD